MDQPKPARDRLHLSFLDGLRGFCAFYVVLHHAYSEMMGYQAQHVGPSRLMFLCQKLFYWGGHHCVTVFICLSGFSLTIPLAKSGYVGLTKAGELKNYFVRRFLRIGPPYFAAIAIILLIAFLVPSIVNPSASTWNLASPILNAQSIILHLLFIHPFWFDEIFKISPQFWSIGVEMQLYAWLPFAIVPVMRKWGWQYAVGLSLLLCWLLVSWTPDSKACFHYVFAFTAGAAVADLIFANRKPNWTNIAGAGFVLAAMTVIGALLANAYKNDHGFRDLLLTPLFAAGLYFLAKQDAAGWIVVRVRAFLSNRIMAFLGKISYSLYLIHYVIIALIHAVTINLGLGIHLRVVALITVAPLLSIIAAWILQMLTEAPSMRLAKKFRDA